MNELWSVRDGFLVCRATMTRERFLQIKSILRFDDPLRRDRDDPLAPARHLFSNFNSQLCRYYIPSEYLTIDEQLLEFHGRVRFQQYISSKPGKFGIKIFWLCCAESFYVLNGVIYIGRGTITPNENLTTRDVSMHLMQPFLDTGRHLTADNWFTSMPLVDELRERGTSYIGTVKNNNRGIPAASKSVSERQRKDTKVYHDDQGTVLVSFWDKGRKPVILVDTFHRHVPVPPVGEKSLTVLEYNRTKSGVDIADKRVKGLSCKRKCRRWPYAVFSNMVDIAGNNGSIIFSARNPEKWRKQEQHYSFLKATGYQLVDAHIRKRLENPASLRSSTKDAIMGLGYDIPQEPPQRQEDQAAAGVQRLEKKKRCNFCPVRADRKTNVCCSSCRLPMCNEHRSNVCINCD